MDLELAVAQAVHAVHLLERAVHGSGSWEIGFGDIWMNATRERLVDRVVFRATVPQICPLDHTLSLRYDGEILATRMADPFEEGDEISWDIGIASEQPVQ